MYLSPVSTKRESFLFILLFAELAKQQVLLQGALKGNVRGAGSAQGTQSVD